MNAITLLIGGKDRPATGNGIYERRNPISGEVGEHGRRCHRRGRDARGRRGGRRVSRLVGARSKRAARSGSTRRPTSWRSRTDEFTA